jgi:hypothetical protein
LFVRALSVAAILGLAIAACATAPTATAPSETPSPTAFATVAPVTPEPTPSPTPTPAPTLAPLPTLTPEPEPTTNVAGQQMIAYYFSARRFFPIYPPTPQIDFDLPGDAPGDSVYRGLNASGQPIFAVRRDYVMTPRTAFHEIGHAYLDLLKRHDQTPDYMGKYWAFRQFPGTWQDSLLQAQQQAPNSLGAWMWSPYEVWAEGFGVSMVGSGREKSMDFGHVIDPTATKAFFLSLLSAP